MAKERVERRLSGILAADMVGYSRLMEADEAGTLAALKTHRAQLIDPEIAAYNGRIVKTTGDGLLAEFASVVDAVAGAAAIQRAMAERNKGVPGDRRIEFRIGINLGDIIIDGDDIYGDGVNIAARLEGLAEPGGICISGAAYEQLKAKVDVGYEDLGERRVKNIEKPVRVYRVLLEPEAVGRAVVAVRTRLRRWKWPAAAVAAIVAVLLVAGYFGVFPIRAPGPDVEPASVERMAFPLPDRPSIAVLPLVNLSGDSSQELFSDGITNGIISDLSRFADLMVIASNSTFTFKGKLTKVRQVAEELGVRYVLEGSIQRIGDEVRVSVQLVDAISGERLWAERYDRELRDIFAVQDEITQKVVATLGAYEGRVADADRARAKRKETTNLSAYELVLLAREARHRFNKEDNAKALKLLERAVAFDPQYARAHVDIAWLHFQDAVQSWSESREVSTRKAHDSAQRAIEIDESFAEGYWVSGEIYAWLLWEPEKSLAAYERALTLNPNHADILADWGGWILPSVLGRAEEGIEVVKKAMRLNPFHADRYERGLATAYFVARRFEEAISTLQSVEHHTIKSRLILVASYAHADRLEEGRIDAATVLNLKPDFSIAAWLQSPYEPYRSLIRDGLRKAALPD